jgi:hypothetical protein
MEISDELFRLAKKKAADEGIPFRDVVEAALRLYLTARPRGKGYKLKWKTVRGKLQPGVNLDDRDALFDLMDGRS